MRSSLLASVLFSTLMACGVDDPVSPGSKLSSAEPEPAGAHCAAGGFANHFGIDENANGRLDPEEVASTTYTCAHGTLLREDAIASGTVCLGGGTYVRSGHDANDNGFLEDPEIENTVTVCQSDELYRGDLKTSDFTTDASREHLSHVRIVTGDLLIDSDAPMPGLELVGGSFELRTSKLVELPALDRIAKNLIGPPPAILNGVGFKNGVLFKAPALTTIGGNAQLFSWEVGGIFSAPALTAVDGGFRLGGQVATVDLGKLARVGRDLDFDLQAQALALPALKTVGGKVLVQGAITALDLPALETTSGFSLYMSNVTSLTLPALKFAPTIVLSRSPVTSIEAPLVSGVKEVMLYGVPDLTVFDLPLVTELDKLWMWKSANRSLDMFANLRSIKVLTLDKCMELVDLGGLDQLTSVGSLTITYNAKLASLTGIEHIASLTGNLTIKNNAALTSLSGLAALTNVAGTISIADNAVLPQAEVDAFLHRLGR